MTESLLHFAQYHEDIPVIDLHRFDSIASALDELEEKIYLFYTNIRNTEQGIRGQSTYVRVVHGIGTGALAEAVHNVLIKNPLVLEWMEEFTGGSCVLRVQ